MIHDESHDVFAAFGSTPFFWNTLDEFSDEGLIEDVSPDQVHQARGDVSCNKGCEEGCFFLHCALADLLECYGEDPCPDEVFYLDGFEVLIKPGFGHGFPF